MEHKRTGKMSEQDTVLAMLTKIWERLLMLDGKLEGMALVAGGGSVSRQEVVPQVGTAEAFRKFTPKQNATVQCLLSGWSNERIAKALNVSINTVKVHVRAICKKLDVHTRMQITLRLQKAFELADEEEYRRVSGGLPKDWAEKWAERTDDPYGHIVKGDE